MDSQDPTFDTVDALTKLEHRLRHDRGHVITGKKHLQRASVAIVLRVNPVEEAKHSARSLAEFLKLNWVKSGILEILFLKRAHNPKDRWSGDVAFPGGRQDEGESDIETAIREAKEEVGLQLDDESQFIHMGRLNDRRTTRRSRGRGNFVVSCFVFLRLLPTAPTLKLQRSEIGAARWVPVSFFQSPEMAYSKKHLTWQDLSARYYPQPVQFIGNLFKLAQIQFPGLVLPHSLPTSSSQVAHNLEVLKHTEEIIQHHNEHDHKDIEFFLWGMTFGLTAELLVLCGIANVHRTWSSNNKVMDWILHYLELYWKQEDRGRVNTSKL